MGSNKAGPYHSDLGARRAGLESRESEGLRRFNPDSAVGSMKNGHVSSVRREIDGLVLLSRRRAVVPW
jgi:hypothetical protein